MYKFSSRIIADVGVSFGDEGKGRLIPEIADDLRGTSNPLTVVLKVNGGANSGHTAGGVKLNLLPAGVVVNDVNYLCIGSGVVADPRKIWWEATPLEKKGYSIINRLRIDERTMVSDVTHRLLDLAWEYYRVNILNEEPRGSTGRGITPAYIDEVGQQQITFSDFLGNKNDFSRKMKLRIERACKTIQYVCQVPPDQWRNFFKILTSAEVRANSESISLGIFSQKDFDFNRFMVQEPYQMDIQEVVEAYWNSGISLKSNISEIREIILKEIAAGNTVLGEFGQSYWLDKRNGFSPNVTASHTYTPELFQSAGIPIQNIHTFGVSKAYDTKVGTHSFITKMEDSHPLTEKLKKLEFGTSTGRQRMVGWFDAVEKGDTLRYGGFQDLMINKLDVLTHSGNWNSDLLICNAYEDSNGNRYFHVPRNEVIRKSLRPIYTKHDGWKEDISEVRYFSDLPKAAQRYTAAMMRSIIQVAYSENIYRNSLPNLRYLGVGPEPSQIIKDVPSTKDLIEIY